MTTVKFYERYGHKHIIADGHANYSEAGTDIVCASVSILLQSLIRECQDEEEIGNIDIARLSVSEGHVEIIVYDPCNKLKSAYSLVLKGIRMLSESYPENVAIL